MLTTGTLWGKPIWGTWWTWDARLTLTLFIFFLFVGYMALRNALTDPTERARFSAVVGILGLLLVPFVQGKAELKGGLYRHNLRWVALHAQGMAALSRVVPSA